MVDQGSANTLIYWICNLYLAPDIAWEIGLEEITSSPLKGLSNVKVDENINDTAMTWMAIDTCLNQENWVNMRTEISSTPKNPI